MRMQLLRHDFLWKQKTDYVRKLVRIGNPSRHTQDRRRDPPRRLTPLRNQDQTEKPPITVTSSARNYASDSLQLQKKFNAVAILNVIPSPPLAVIGFPVDAITGALRKPADPAWPLVMKPIGDTSKKEIVINIRVRKRQHQSNYANLFRVGVGLAKWTGIDAPTSRFAFSAGYGRTFNLWKNEIVLEPTLGIALKGMKYKEELGSIGNANLTRNETGTAWYVEAIIPARYIYGDEKKKSEHRNRPLFRRRNRRPDLHNRRGQQLLKTERT